MQALLDQGGYDMPQRGDIREGTIISVSPQEVIIDLGLKREAIVPANDLSRLEKSTLAEIQEGTTWPVYILQPSDREGNLIVSLSRALQEKDWLVAQQMMDNNEMFEAEVSGHNAGGLEVIFGKLRGFVPASHISTLPREMSPDERKAHLATFVGKMIPVKVVEVDRKRRRLIMSERAARRRWQREHRKQLLDEIEVGETRTGIVRSLSEFGAFVDLGGADGLVHISELAWFPVAHPSEVLKVGQEVEVKVLRIDKQRERVGLSLKRVQPDPWSHIEELYNVNELVEAVVTRVTDFGAFVRLRSGVEGLLHVSEMADIRPDHPQSLVSPGDLLLLRVLRIEPDRRRIGLSLRQVSETEWAEWAASYREQHGTPEAETVEEAEAVPGAEAETAVETEAAMDVEAIEGEPLLAVEPDLVAEAEQMVEEPLAAAPEFVIEPEAPFVPEGEAEVAAESIEAEVTEVEDEVLPGEEQQALEVLEAEGGVVADAAPVEVLEVAAEAEAAVEADVAAEAADVVADTGDAVADVASDAADVTTDAVDAVADAAAEAGDAAADAADVLVDDDAAPADEDEVAPQA
jgi:small subunit ribosomal protein S1